MSDPRATGVLAESINRHIWQSPPEERDPETMQMVGFLLADLSAAGLAVQPITPGVGELREQIFDATRYAAGFDAAAQALIKTALAERDTEIEQLRFDRAHARSELAKADAENNAAGQRAEQAEATLRDLVDPDPCWFDHHGGCQAHGYLSLKPGEQCPHAEAKELLEALDRPGDQPKGT